MMRASIAKRIARFIFCFREVIETQSKLYVHPDLFDFIPKKEFDDDDEYLLYATVNWSINISKLNIFVKKRMISKLDEGLRYIFLNDWFNLVDTWIIPCCRGERYYGLDSATDTRGEIFCVLRHNPYFYHDERSCCWPSLGTRMIPMMRLLLSKQLIRRCSFSMNYYGVGKLPKYSYSMNYRCVGLLHVFVQFAINHGFNHGLFWPAKPCGTTSLELLARTDFIDTYYAIPYTEDLVDERHLNKTDRRFCKELMRLRSMNIIEPVDPNVRYLMHVLSSNLRLSPRRVQFMVEWIPSAMLDWVGGKLPLHRSAQYFPFWEEIVIMLRYAIRYYPTIGLSLFFTRFRLNQRNERAAEAKRLERGRCYYCGRYHKQFERCEKKKSDTPFEITCD